MAQLQVIAAKLNKRTYPVENVSDKSNVVGTVLRGFSFESQSQLENNQGTWYQDRDGYYYWSGGLSNQLTSLDAVIPVNYPKWMTDLNLPEIWKFATGKNVGVAVLDTGIVPGNTDLPFNKAKSFTFDKAVSLFDTNGHGTNCAALIGARNSNTNYIGVAPGCNLFICKISEKSYFEQDSDTIRYADAINWCAEQEEIQVISISWGDIIDDQDILESIQNAIDKATANKKVILCAIGDASDFNVPAKMSPACMQNTIGIGAIPVPGKLYPFINSFLITAAQGYDIISYGIDDQSTKLYGTSQANAIVAGITALIIEKMSYAFSYSQILQTLQNISKKTNYTINQKSIDIPVVDGELLLQYFKN